MLQIHNSYFFLLKIQPKFPHAYKNYIVSIDQETTVYL